MTRNCEGGLVWDACCSAQHEGSNNKTCRFKKHYGHFSSLILATVDLSSPFSVCSPLSFKLFLNIHTRTSSS